MTHRPFAALQHDDFRKLMLGQVVSIAGTRMRDVAIAWHLYQLTHSPLLLGMVGVARLVPMVVLGLASGVMADRVDRRRLMMATQVVMLVASLILGLITVSGQVQPWSIYVLLVVSAAAATFDLPARQALIPQLVPREHLPNALSMNMIAYQGASVCGPMVAGLMLAEYGVAAVYFVDAATFLAVLLALVSMEHRHVPRGPEVEVPTWHAALKGLRFVLGNRLILSTMLVDFFAMVFGSASTMMPIFADQVLGVNERGLGMLYAAPGVGAVLAALAMSFAGTLRSQGPTMLWAVVLYAAAMIGFGLSTSYPLSLLLLAVTGATDSVSAVIRGTIRQLVTPDELRGRMTSVNMLFFVGGPHLGEVEVGALAQFMGVGPAVAVGGVACLGIVGWIAARTPELRSYDQ